MKLTLKIHHLCSDFFIIYSKENQGQKNKSNLYNATGINQLDKNFPTLSCNLKPMNIKKNQNISICYNFSFPVVFNEVLDYRCAFSICTAGKIQQEKYWTSSSLRSWFSFFSPLHFQCVGKSLNYSGPNYFICIVKTFN